MASTTMAVTTAPEEEKLPSLWYVGIGRKTILTDDTTDGTRYPVRFHGTIGPSSLFPK